MIQPIPTWYAGHKFRSRLEARWAVFFDTLELKWEYEPQGYLVGPAHDQRAYLPDFWLPQHEVWAEVKGDPKASDMRPLYYAAHADGGLPGQTEGQRLLLLGNIPQVRQGWLCWQHSLAYTRDHVYGDVLPFSIKAGVYTRLFRFTAGGIEADEDYGIFVDPDELECHHAPGWCSHNSIWHFDAYTSDDPCGFSCPDAKAIKAYVAARSARFEHGQSGGSS